MAKQIEDMSILELKGLVYDLSFQAEQIRNNILNLNQLISKKVSETQPITSQENNAPK